MPSPASFVYNDDMKTSNNNLPQHAITPPRHIIWSTDRIDLSNAFQRKQYIQQILTNGRSEDIKQLDINEVAQLLDKLHLPKVIYDLWKSFLEYRHA